MRLLIIGCGYVGSALARELKARGYDVTGVVQTPESAALLTAEGIPARSGDCSTPEGARAACEGGAEGVIFCVSSRGGDYQRTYVEGMRQVLAALENQPPKLFFYTSSTSVYSQTDSSWVDESSRCEPTHRNGKLLLETENLLRAAALKKSFSAYVLRLSGIYGPGRHSFLDRVVESTREWPHDEARWLNHIHRDDVVGAICHLIDLAKKSPSSETIRLFNVSDNEPFKQLAYVKWVNAQLKRTPPRFLPDNHESRRKGGSANRRISNAALRETGWTLKYPTYVEGLPKLIELAAKEELAHAPRRAPHAAARKESKDKRIWGAFYSGNG